MLLVAIPLSQRTRSSPVTRIQPVSVRGWMTAPVRRAASCAAGDEAARVSDWEVGVIGILMLGGMPGTHLVPAAWPRFRRGGATLRTLIIRFCGRQLWGVRVEA